MNKLATGQSKEARAKDSLQERKGKPQSSEGFEAELSQAGAMAMQAMPVQPQQVAIKNPAESGLVDRAQKSPVTLKPAVSSNTVSALTGLKPWSPEWTFQGESTGLELPAQGSEGAAPKGAPAQGAALQAKRGEADAALESKLNQLALDAVAAQGKGAQTPDGERGIEAGTQSTPGRPGIGQADGHEALAAQGMGHLGADQLPGMRELNGSAVQAKGQGSKGNAPMGSALSGGEFLSALNGVKAGAREGSASGDGLSQGRDEGGAGGKAGAKPSLRVIEGGGKARKGIRFGDEPVLQQSPASLASGTLVKAGLAPAASEVAGHVVKGANAEDRLSSESLIGVGNGIRDLSAHGGGEMRIRLKPENLGELHVRVVTDGRNVGLHIQASDERAKKILEESMSHLKDSLATQSLSLGQVDLIVAHAQGGASTSDGQGQQHGQHPHAQGMYQDMSGGGGQQAGREAWNGGGNDAGPRIAPRAAASAPGSRMGAPRGQAAYASGRIDVQA